MPYRIEGSTRTQPKRWPRAALKEIPVVGGRRHLLSLLQQVCRARLEVAVKSCIRNLRVIPRKSLQRRTVQGSRHAWPAKGTCVCCTMATSCSISLAASPIEGGAKRVAPPPATAGAPDAKSLHAPGSGRPATNWQVTREQAAVHRAEYNGNVLQTGSNRHAVCRTHCFLD